MFAGQVVGIREVEDQIWLVSFMDYDLGYFDNDRGQVEPGPNPFAPDKVLTMCPEYTFYCLAEREGLSETIPGFGPSGAFGDQIRSRRICRTLARLRFARVLNPTSTADIKMPAQGGRFYIWRRGRDSNPRWAF
jgi:hypothetical protein